MEPIVIGKFPLHSVTPSYPTDHTYHSTNTVTDTHSAPSLPSSPAFLRACKGSCNFFYYSNENAAMLKSFFFGLLSFPSPSWGLQLPFPRSRRGVRPTRVTRRAADTRNMRDRNLAKV